jgi:hypothetical protein
VLLGMNNSCERLLKCWSGEIIEPADFFGGIFRESRRRNANHELQAQNEQRFCAF